MRADAAGSEWSFRSKGDGCPDKDSKISWSMAVERVITVMVMMMERTMRL